MKRSHSREPSDAPDGATTDAMVDACLRVHEVAREVETPELVWLARLLIYQAGQQIAGDIRAASGEGDHSDEH